MVTSTLAPMAWRAVLDEAHAHGRFAGLIRVRRADMRVTRLRAAIDYGGGIRRRGNGASPAQRGDPASAVGPGDGPRSGREHRQGRTFGGGEETHVSFPHRQAPETL